MSIAVASEGRAPEGPCNGARSRMLGAGTIIAGKYRLVRVLGRGGMGTVIEAQHVQLGTSVALKFVHRSIVDTASVTERFFREARATAALGSEHVCRVFDVGTYDGAPYLVMELLEGIDLEKVLRREKRLSPPLACSYLIQACAGVAEAHAAQIVHRDLKPGNLFLVRRPDGTPLIKVLDFGIAKAPREAELGLTGTDAVLGSPAYMSLEQLRSSRLVDTRSDIWSLGVILYELVAGRRPFVGEGVADLALRIAMEPIPRLPDGPAKLDAIIGRCLEREPAQRYQDVGELARALAPFAGEPERRLAKSIGRTSRPSNQPIIFFPAKEADRAAGASALLAPSAPTQATEITPPMATTMHTAGVIERPGTVWRARSRIGVAVLAASLVGGISLAIAATRGGDEGPQAAGQAAAPETEGNPARIAAASPSPSPEPPPAPTVVTPPPAAPAPTVTLEFSIEPAAAAVELDGVFVTARRIKVHRDDAAHQVRITAPGFAAHEGELRFDESQKLTVRLRRAAPQQAARPASRPARPARIESRSPYE